MAVKDAKGNELRVGDLVKFTRPLNKVEYYTGRYNDRDTYIVTDLEENVITQSRIMTRCIRSDHRNCWVSEYFTKVVDKKNHLPGWF